MVPQGEDGLGGQRSDRALSLNTGLWNIVLRVQTDMLVYIF